MSVILVMLHQRFDLKRINPCLPTQLLTSLNFP